MPVSTIPRVNPLQQDKNLLQVPKPNRPRLLTRVSWAAEDIIANDVAELNLPKCMYHFCAAVYGGIILYLVWVVLPLPGHWPAVREDDRVAIGKLDASK